MRIFRIYQLDFLLREQDSFEIRNDDIGNHIDCNDGQIFMAMEWWWFFFSSDGMVMVLKFYILHRESLIITHGMKNLNTLVTSDQGKSGAMAQDTQYKIDF